MMATSRRRSTLARSPGAEGTIARFVHEELRRLVLEGRWKPGHTLVELDIARRYGVSRAPAREALKLLEREGLVSAVPRRGYVVSEITVRQIHELFDLRLILEREAAVRAARTATPQDIAHLESLVGDPYLPGDQESYRRFLAQNRVFHGAIARLARNERLAALVEALLEELERLFHLGLDVRDRAEALVQEHRDLVEAIRAHDPERASHVAAAQIENARHMVLEGVMQGSLSANIR
ncbi:MAG: GntR family transcriptional regulator [Armatimonadota bacterium]|nr:GntR family transcriptional regulator [Armatimonadota bacterium]